MLNEILIISYNLFKKNINLSHHLLWFFLITMILVPNVAGIRGLLFFFIFFIFTCAFSAGWFNAFKYAYNKDFPKTDIIITQDNDNINLSTNKNSYDDKLDFPPFYYKEFFEGVGQYFVKFLCGGIIYITIFCIVFYLIHQFISHFVVIPPTLKAIDINSLSTMTQEDLNKIIDTLTKPDQIKIIKIALLISGSFIFTSYLTMMYPIALINSEKNVFYSLFLSLKSVLKNIPVSLLFFTIFSALLFVMSIGFSTPQNLIIFFISFILYCYLSVFYYMTLFVYYEKTK